MHNSVISITNKEKNSLGTGFVIDRDENGSFIATCGHVVNSCGQSVIINGMEATIISNGYEDGVDLAVLYAKDVDLKPLPVCLNEKAIKASVIGYTKLKSDPKRETITNIPLKTQVLIEKSNSVNIDSIKLSPPESINKGYSGSPVICEDTKMVIGIVNIQLGQDVNYAICAKHLLEMYPNIKMPSEQTPKVSYCRKNIISELGEKEKAIITHEVKNDLEKSLQLYSSQEPVWVEPQLFNIEESTDINKAKAIKFEIQDIIENPMNIEIYSRQQYGSTCLAYYLVQEAWLADEQTYWLYLNINQLKPKGVKNIVKRKLKKLQLKIEDVGCIVLDELTNGTKNVDVIFQELDGVFCDIPIILMRKTVDNSLLENKVNIETNRNFSACHLWSLPRFIIRDLIKQYNNQKFIEDENKVVNKVIADLEVINIPRTPQNCLTLLKISETNFDHSPVNRAEMIHRVLTLLFNFDHIPSYKTKPDLIDVEHILGYLCEKIIREKSYYFSQKSFSDLLSEYCNANELDVDVSVIFDVLCNNSILIAQDNQFHFKFSFWVYYFSAHRMLHDDTFRQFVLDDCSYLSYPEIIEFYSGIDRQRNDLLECLINDIKTIKSTVIEKCGLPENFNIFDHAQWLPSEEQIKELNEEIATGVLDSNLPTEIKDNFADRGYNPRKPLNQGIGSILKEYSVLRMMKSIGASSKALRNSSYVKVGFKHELLEEILAAWEELCKVLISIAPMLSEHGRATVEGASFTLYGDFGKEKMEIFQNIIKLIPTNINTWFGDDIYSEKIGTMLIKKAESEENKLYKHILNLIIINKRPSGWDEHIKNYIQQENKNSFYLMDIFENLQGLYQYSFASGGSLKKMKELIKLSLAKHIYGNEKKSARIKDDNIPKRNERIL